MNMTLNRITTALSLMALTAGSLAITEGASFAASRHPVRHVKHCSVAKKRTKKHTGRKVASVSSDDSSRKPKPGKPIRRKRKPVGPQVNVDPSNNRPVSVTA